MLDYFLIHIRMIFGLLVVKNFFSDLGKFEQRLVNLISKLVNYNVKELKTVGFPLLT